MRRIFPTLEPDLDPRATYAADARPAPPHRPWVLLNMITSIDGAISVEGRSGGLGGPADKAVFHVLRSLADVILVGSGTVIAEHYRPPVRADELRSSREQRGLSPVARLAIVTGSARIDPEHDAFTDPDNRPFLVTVADPDDERRARIDRLREVADVIQTGDASGVGLGAALVELRQRGVGLVVCEGGPTLNGALLEQGLVDELCVTVSPLVAGGSAPRMIVGAPPIVQPATLQRVIEADNMLLLRYTLDADAAADGR